MSNQLTVIEQREVTFYDDDIIAALVDENGRRTIYVPLRPVCDRLGIDWSGQRQRINRDPVLSQVTQGVGVITAPSTDGRGGGMQEMLCIPLDYLNGWLFGINANRVNPEIRDRLIRYQMECYRILSEAFQQQNVTAAPIEGIDIDALLRTGDDPEAYAYRIALAVATTARQQLVLRYQLQQQDERLDGHEKQLGAYGERLAQIEAAMGNKARYITNNQASRISQAVKAVGLELGKRSGRNEFGGVYGELYRRFEVAGYRELPAGQYDEAMAFLRQWYSSLADGDVPF